MKRLTWLLFCALLGMATIAGASDKEAAPKKFPIVYSDEYNISFWGFEKLHPFDSQKYGRVFERLEEDLGLTEENVYQPEMVTDEELLTIHSQAYLDTLEDSSVVARIAEMDLATLSPNFLLQHYILNPLRYGTEGSIMGVDLALKYGWAINLGGGYHHAKPDSGAAFCFFADIPLAVKAFQKKHPGQTVLIIDLDAHQGNGNSTILGPDPLVHILDVYNSQVYPFDDKAAALVDFRYPVDAYIKDEAYLSLIGKVVPETIKATNPAVIIYNAGTDIHENDKLGAMNVTRAGIIKRDEMVFRNALDRKIPILMILSGGYTNESSGIIADSIEHLMKTVLNKG